MRILKKRGLACLFDSFVLCIAIVSLQLLLKNALNSKILMILMFIPFFNRDILFKNASLGKFLFGIAIYDKSWKQPSFRLLFIRSVVVNTVGYFLLWKAIFIDGDFISIIDFERDKFGTRVVDRKVLKRLKEEAKHGECSYSENLTKLYDEYIRNLYCK